MAAAAVPPSSSHAAWLDARTLAGTEVGSSEPRTGSDALALGKVAKLVEIKSLEFHRCVSRLGASSPTSFCLGARPL